jgi:CRISPR-associated protein Cas2
MRKTLIVAYDIGDPKRLAEVYKLMRGYGDRLQLSAFLCQLTKRERIELQGRLEELIHHKEDQVIFADLGPSEGRAKDAIRAVGLRYTYPERVAVIL